MIRMLLCLLAAASVVTAAAPGDAQTFRERLLQRRLGQQSPAPTGAQDIAYGSDPLQHLDFWHATAAKKDAPLVVFVHGGGWKRGDKSNATGAEKVTHFLAAGYAFASLNYRLVPKNTVEQQAQDVADAVAYLRREAARLGVDPRRIVLIGHSAGAHLVALVGTDPRYFAKAGLGMDAAAGIVALDGAAYDVPRQIAEGGRLMHDTYLEAFGSDPARQKALSPTVQAAAPNAPSFLILHIARTDGKVQSNALAAALKAAGTPVAVEGFPSTGLKGHMEINRDLGRADYPATPVVDAYLEQRFAR